MRYGSTAAVGSVTQRETVRTASAKADLAAGHRHRLLAVPCCRRPRAAGRLLLIVLFCRLAAGRWASRAVATLRVGLRVLLGRLLQLPRLAQPPKPLRGLLRDLLARCGGRAQRDAVLQARKLHSASKVSSCVWLLHLRRPGAVQAVLAVSAAVVRDKVRGAVARPHFGRLRYASCQPSPQPVAAALTPPSTPPCATCHILFYSCCTGQHSTAVAQHSTTHTPSERHVSHHTPLPLTRLPLTCPSPAQVPPLYTPSPNPPCQCFRRPPG